MKKVIEGLWAAGKRTFFYAEGDWTPYLEHIAELPEKSIVFYVDQTNMSRAKEMLGGRFCLSGGVPLGLLSFGTPADVRNYCRKLINEIAADGGFIMDVAGSIQTDAKVENVKALLDATREFGRYE